MDNAKFLRQAFEEAMRSYAERTGSTPGLPIGAVMVQHNAAEPFARSGLQSPHERVHSQLSGRVGRRYCGPRSDLNARQNW
jgi:hypothetical protein